MESKQMRERKRVNLKLSPEVHADLVRYARAHNKTVQSVVAMLVIAAVCGKEESATIPEKPPRKRKR